MRANVFGFMPYPLQVLVGLLAYRSMSATLYGQGISRFSAEEISAFRTQIWESFDALLVGSKRKGSVRDDSPFWLLGGTGPSEADSVLGPESRKIVKSFPALLDYAERIHSRYFPDYAQWERDLC
ncbi:hypothetical protein LHYA1_G006485 [Lachnellula hyalina]|uniref:Uncharacterized protein n=1 Tax=Lachnellula hyalina TaxID=1316788 RepID=A0A8H8QYL3_9HELO|nr:uncharacterized protein LHYA1_G006485 [Lachnellula hyalina]TVY25158.1 hypothetical protein LHYA1_G006485 [Lachnellula hyalina]